MTVPFSFFKSPLHDRIVKLEIYAVSHAKYLRRIATEIIPVSIAISANFLEEQNSIYKSFIPNFSLVPPK